MIGDLDHIAPFVRDEHVKIVVALALDLPEMSARVSWRRYEMLQVWGVIEMRDGRNVLTEAGRALAAKISATPRWSPKIDGWIAVVLATREVTP